jgi:hypothetical protein
MPCSNKSKTSDSVPTFNKTPILLYKDMGQWLGNSLSFALRTKQNYFGKFLGY